MSHQCPSCNQTFTAQQALCEDWRNPEKSFGCPHCGKFYKKDLRSNLRQSICVGIMAGGIATPAAMLIGRSLFNGDNLSLFYGVAIWFSCVAMLVIGDWRNRA